MRQITVGQGQIAVLADLVQTGPLGGYNNVELVGTEQQTYDQLAIGELMLTSDASISGSPEQGISIDLAYSITGTLSQ